MAESKEMRITGDDEVGTGCQGTLEDTVIQFVLLYYTQSLQGCDMHRERRDTPMAAAMTAAFHSNLALSTRSTSATIGSESARVTDPVLTRSSTAAGSPPKFSAEM